MVNPLKCTASRVALLQSSKGRVPLRKSWDIKFHDKQEEGFLGVSP